MSPNIVESSAVVRVLRWLSRDSAVASGVRSVRRFFDGIDRAFARAAAAKESKADPAQIAAILRASALVRAGDAIFSAPFVAWQHSRVRPFVEEIRAAVGSMSVPQRIRLAGWMLAVALFTRSALYVLSGATVTRPTLGVWCVVAVVALVLMTASRQVAAGWNEWKRRRR